VGSYKASIVPTLDDFDRLDTEVFDVDENLLPMLRRHYPYRFGFIVCQLKPGNRSYHPFAYTHDLDSCGKLFVPTRHYHPQSHGHATADWDHIIYSPLTDLDNTKQKGYEFRGTKDVAWSKLPEAYRWGSVVQMSRWEMEGDFKNMDLWATSYHREADAEVWNSLGKHLVDLIGGSMIVQGYFKN
jgi:hypothetical protein